MTFEEALEYMHGLHRFGVKLGNERFEALLARLGNPHLAGYGIAHVAGTKGKGSTTALISAILMRHGFGVGSYYSPYVYDVRERVQVDGGMISPTAFARHVTEIRPHAESLAVSDLGPTTEFELKTAVGFCHFAEQHVDYAAVEVGIGGRLDATNVLRPQSTVITNIGLDHTHILGDTHALIASEKAGIIKVGVDCVTGAENPEALDVIRCVAKERSAPLRIAGPDGSASDVTWSMGGIEFSVNTPERAYNRLVCGMRGEYQRANAACAIAAVEALSRSGGFEMDPDAVRNAIASTRLPGRFEIVGRDPIVVLDGAHNGIAAEALAKEVRELSFGRLFLVVGMIEGHAPEAVLEPFAAMAHAVISTEPTWMKRQPAEKVASAARRLGMETTIVSPPSKALALALEMADAEDMVLVTGSFYTVGDIGAEMRRGTLCGDTGENAGR